MRPGTYAAVVLSGLLVLVAGVLVFGTDSRFAETIGLGMLLTSQALLSHATHRLLGGAR